MKSPTLFSLPVLAGLFALAVLTGCGSPDASMQAFVGQPSSELLARLGPPKRRIPEGQGGQIWIYIEESQATTQPGLRQPGSLNNNGYGGGSASPVSAFTSPGFTSQSQREFFIDGSGTIYKYRSRGR